MTPLFPDTVGNSKVVHAWREKNGLFVVDEEKRLWTKANIYIGENGKRFRAPKAFASARLSNPFVPYYLASYSSREEYLREKRKEDIDYEVSSKMVREIERESFYEWVEINELNKMDGVTIPKHFIAI